MIARPVETVRLQGIPVPCMQGTQAGLYCKGACTATAKDGRSLQTVDFWSGQGERLPVPVIIGVDGAVGLPPS